MSNADIYICPTCGMVCDVCGCPPEPPPERRILTDLIAELVGDDGDGHAITADGDDDCSVCQMIDRAEARLHQTTEGDA